MPPFLHREKSKKNKKVWVGMKASGQWQWVAKGSLIINLYFVELHMQTKQQVRSCGASGVGLSKQVFHSGRKSTKACFVSGHGISCPAQKCKHGKFIPRHGTTYPGPKLIIRVREKPASSLHLKNIVVERCLCTILFHHHFP
jgi:hypothetical protein